jgi:4-hydroxy-3-methylbut-2-enyl diphosphate reductase
MKTMPLNHDAMIVIGSRSSANTMRLYEISRALNPRSYRIESAAEIRPSWFKNAVTVGVTAGASTPQSAMRSVIGRLRQLIN